MSFDLINATIFILSFLVFSVFFLKKITTALKSFFCFEINLKKAVSEVQSPLQEQEEGPHKGQYFKVSYKTKNINLNCVHLRNPILVPCWPGAHQEWKARGETTHCTNYTSHSTLNTQHSTLHKHFKKHTKYITQHTAQITHHTAH